ncbi:ABC transporter [Roseivirga sp. 4D4]|uniref:ABC transporter permease n=1 Tax=Roseivirga sp. 4D4 TaxID=1889784 RepID=UPI000852B887|nr:ABC transporter permease [Roseivirga sp. 4D4]OEK01011.1 ABC transporter [Roseivirga sp. 4D4]
MNWSTILGISKTHLKSRVKQSSIAALGVTFGIGTFITLGSFMTGLNGLLDGLILNRTPHIHIYNEIAPSEEQPITLADEFVDGINIIHSIKPKKSQLRIHNALPLINHLKNQEGVRGVIPQVQAQVFYLAGSIELNGVVFGVDVMEEDRLFNIGDYIIEGSVQDLARNNNGIILGAGLAKKLSLKVGDRVQLSSVNGGLFPLKIVGFYQSGLADIDNVQSYVNLPTAQRILGEGKNYISDINVKLFDMEEAPLMASQISSQYNLTAIDIKTANAQFETGTQIRNIITYAVSVTLLIVAGFGIYNILNMMIYEKMNDIAILKATGFSGKDVKMIFISQALIIGCIGGVLGLMIGFGLSVGISYIPFETEALPTITTFPVNNDPSFYIIGITFALLATFFAGYLPASKAEKIDPVDIIRGQ